MNRPPSIYFSGQGVVSAAIRDAMGVPQGFLEIGNVPSLTIKPGRAAARYGTANLIGAQRFGVPAGDPPGFSVQVEDARKTNLSTFLSAADTEVAGGTVTNEPTLGFKGRIAPLKHISLTSVTSVTDAGGTTTYVAGVDYDVDLPSGAIRPLTTGSITDGAVLHVTYVHGSYSKFAPFTQAPVDVWLQFAGLNTLDTSKPCVVDIYKTTLPPIDKLDLVNDEILAFGFDGVMKRDTTQEAPAVDGQFFRIRMVE